MGLLHPGTNVAGKPANRGVILKKKVGENSYRDGLARRVKPAIIIASNYF